MVNDLQYSFEFELDDNADNFLTVAIESAFCYKFVS